MIKTVDNYFAFENDMTSYYFKFDSLGEKKDKKAIAEKLEITLKEYQAKSPNNTFFSFFQKDEEKKASKNSDDLIISIVKNPDGSYQAKTGNYIGKFKWNGLDIEIGSRFGDRFLERMLNFANDVYLDDVSISGEKKNGDIDYSKFIIYHLFIQNLEKAYLLGLPKSYTTVRHHEPTLKGRIDINAFMKSDIPYQGKISSVAREQREIQDIVDVLHKAVKVIAKSNKAFLKNISHIVPHLKQMRSNSFVSNEMIKKAMNSKALQNPIFAPYKKVLRYAKYIINADSIKPNDGENEQTYGFLANVAELFEIYMTKLLQKEFGDWHIESPKIELYPNQFFARKIISDIVMIKGDDVMVFDTKYKKMAMRGKNQYDAGDIDRNDFFQINTYMGYYKQKAYQIIAGGLLYPMDQFDQEKCHSDNWFGNDKTKFIVDGIVLSDYEQDSIISSEQHFLGRLKEYIF